MELVSYDTIKTVRSVLANVLRMEYVKQNKTNQIHNKNHNINNNNNNNKNDPDQFNLFMGFPRTRLNDDSKSLGDLGLVPNGVLHLVQK